MTNASSWILLGREWRDPSLPRPKHSTYQNLLEVTPTLLLLDHTPRDAQGGTIGVSVQGQGLDWKFFVGSFQLRVFHDPMIPKTEIHFAKQFIYVPNLAWLDPHLADGPWMSLIFFRHILFPVEEPGGFMRNWSLWFVQFLIRLSNQQKIYHTSSAFLLSQQYLKKGHQVEIKEI